jgi:hypothetical protein
MMLSRSCGLLGSTSMLVALASGIEEDQGLTSKHLQPCIMVLTLDAD